MIIIAGTIDLEPSKRAACLEASKPLQQATRDDEASLAAHFEHPNYLNMRTMFGQFGLLGADNKKYRCDLSEPVYDDTRTPRADFFTATS